MTRNTATAVPKYALIYSFALKILIQFEDEIINAFKKYVTSQ